MDGGGRSTTAGSEAWYWTVPLKSDKALRAVIQDADTATLVEALAGTAEPDEDDRPDQGGLTAHVRNALQSMSAGERPAGRPMDLIETLALIGLASPGNCAWRALSRVIKPGDPVTPLGHWR